MWRGTLISLECRWKELLKIDHASSYDSSMRSVTYGNLKIMPVWDGPCRNIYKCDLIYNNYADFWRVSIHRTDNSVEPVLQIERHSLGRICGSGKLIADGMTSSKGSEALLLGTFYDMIRSKKIGEDYFRRDQYACNQLLPVSKLLITTFCLLGYSAKVRERTVMVCCSQHPRLGTGSPFRVVPREVMRYILEMTNNSRHLDDLHKQLVKDPHIDETMFLNQLAMYLNISTSGNAPHP